MDIKLSVCIIAKNEEKMIEDCIRSVANIATEIILIDTGSSDNTIRIAQNYNCKVFNYNWNNDFAQARNIGLSKAIYPFILSIDADERLSNPDEVVNVLKKSKDTTGGWLIEVISDATRPDGAVDTYKNKLLRLFRNHQKIRFSGIIHEQILNSIVNLGLQIENTDINIIHLGYAYSNDLMKAKQLRNVELLKIALLNEPENAYYYFNIAKTYIALNNNELAEYNIQRALEFSKTDAITRPQALNYGAVIAFHNNNIELAIQRAKESLNIVPVQVFASFILGEIYDALNQLDLAYNYYVDIKKAISNQNFINQIVGDYYLPLDILHFKIGKCLIAMKKYELAELEFDRGLNINPKQINCLVGKANILFSKKQYIQSKQLLEQALIMRPDQTEIQEFIYKVNSYLDMQQTISIPIININKSKSPKQDNLLSLCMIVKNEENMLPQCLDSVRNIVDEIIIVDTGSDDNTINIANQFGAKVIEYTWNDNFADARNESLKHASGKWILYLDADERLHNNSKEIIIDLLNNASNEIGAFICTIESNHINLTGNKEFHRGAYPRIFRNYGYPEINFVGRVHEQITPSIFKLNKQIAISEIIITHLGYNQSREAMEAKIKRNYAMLIQHVNDEPLNSYAWYQLGQTLAQMSLVKEAEDAIRFAISLGKMSNSIYASAAATLAQLTGNKKEFQEALHWAEQSLQKAPNQVYALNIKAYALLYLNKPKEAEMVFYEVLKRVKSKQGVPFSGFDVVIDESIILNGIQQAQEMQGNKAEHNY